MKKLIKITEMLKKRLKDIDLIKKAKSKKNKKIHDIDKENYPFWDCDRIIDYSLYLDDKEI